MEAGCAALVALAPATARGAPTRPTASRAYFALGHIETRRPRRAAHGADSCVRTGSCRAFMSHVRISFGDDAMCARVRVACARPLVRSSRTRNTEYGCLLYSTPVRFLPAKYELTHNNSSDESQVWMKEPMLVYFRK